jgi:TRAP-type C4-dicarboxylate transport system permease small subunit
MHNKLDNLLHHIENGLLLITLTAMIVLALSQIVMRNIFGSGIEWSDPTLRVLVLWLSLLGAIAATKQNKHITIDIVSRLLPRTGRLIAFVVTQLFSAIICAIISYHAAGFVKMEYEDQVSAFSGVPAWLCELIIPVGFGVMALRFLIKAGGSLKRGAINGAPTDQT